MEEFETFDDIQEINRYLKKAQALHNKLEEAQSKVTLYSNSFTQVH